jgi:hypothetical protein
MAGIVEWIPQALQAVLGSVSDEIARTCGFIVRQRGFSGSQFVQALVFGWLGRPRASVEILSQRLGITGSGLQQRLTELAAEFLRLVFLRALQVLLASRAARIPLLAKFNGIYAEDCTTISLPAELADLFPGCGGSDETSGKSALRVFTCYELKTGKMQHMAIAGGRGSDTVVARAHAPDLPPGALRIRDMGFFDRQLMEKDTAAGVYWISRVPAGTTLRSGDGPVVQVSEFLDSQRAHVQKLDSWLWIGQADNGARPMWCRFLAIRCPQEVAANRRRKVREKARRKGRTASQRQLAMCDWTVMITNAPEAMLSLAQAWELYCARWQIELLFKRWKGLGGLQISTAMKAGRVLCELYAKLLGMLIAHWFTLIRGGPLEGFSLTRAIQIIQDRAGQLADALRWPERLPELVAEMAKLILRIPKQQRRTKRPTTRQRLFRPRLET